METLPKKKQRGRPAKGPSAKFKAQYFHHEITRRCPHQTNHANELFIKGLNKYPKKNEYYIKSGQLDKYARGENEPKDETIDKYEIALHRNLDSLRFVLHHPFWNIIEKNNLKLNELYSLLSKLSPDITELVFMSYDNDTYVRKDNTHTKENKFLRRKNDLDALTTSIGLIHECRLMNHRLREYFLIRNSFFIFTNVIAAYDFYPFAKELFEYLRTSFFYSPVDEEWSDSIKDFNIENSIFRQTSLILFAEDCGLLKNYTLEEQLFFLAICDDYITPQIFSEIFSDKKYELLKMPEIKKLSRRLKDWRKKHPKNKR